MPSRRRLRLAEAGQIGRDQTVAIGKQRDEVAEHVACRRETVQQQDDRRIARSGFAVEHVDVADPLRAKLYLRHRHLPRSLERGGGMPATGDTGDGRDGHQEPQGVAAMQLVRPTVHRRPHLFTGSRYALRNAGEWPSFEWLDFRI